MQKNTIAIFILFIFLAVVSGFLIFQNYSLQKQSRQIATMSANLASTEAKLALISDDVYKANTDANTFKKTLEENSKELESTKKSLGIEINSLRKTESEYNKSLRRTNSSLNNSIVALQKSVESGKNATQNIIKKWKRVLARVKCSDSKSGSLGSGVFLNIGAYSVHPYPAVVTNRHVLEGNKDELLKTCEIDFTYSNLQKKDISIKDSVDLFSKQDIAFLKVGDLYSELKLKGSYRICDIKPSVGDNVLIFGYPKIGFKSGITVTEGIISGYEDGFYSTSAKIARGNSGGAAVSVKNDCYFGTPTSVYSGKVESLGRILEITNSTIAN